MKSHFNLKSLAFYGVAIGSVLLLFKAVTAYGESNLKAPIAIDGRYRLSFAPNVPNCLKSNDLVLIIEQSGIYLNGSLLPVAPNTQTAVPADGKPSLTGLLSNQQLDLSGTVPSSALCSSNTVKIQSRVEEKNLEGKIALILIPQTIEFTAQKEMPDPLAENSSNH